VWYRTLRYYGCLLVVFLRGLPFSAIVAISETALRLWPRVVINNILVIDPSAETRASFVKAVRAALALIETGDPRRFTRVRREIKAIINMPVAGGSEYSRFLRTSRIDGRHFSAIEDPGTAITLLACRLISHATFGHICTRKLTTNHDYTRVKKLCFREEARFAKVLGLDLGEDWGWFGSEPVPASDQQRREWAKRQIKRMKAPGRKRKTGVGKGVGVSD